MLPSNIVVKFAKFEGTIETGLYVTEISEEEIRPVKQEEPSTPLLRSSETVTPAETPKFVHEVLTPEQSEQLFGDTYDSFFCADDCKLTEPWTSLTLSPARCFSDSDDVWSE